MKSHLSCAKYARLGSPSMRREWIEMLSIAAKTTDESLSPSMRREWIEILNDFTLGNWIRVSPSMRREWIEMVHHSRQGGG